MRQRRIALAAGLAFVVAPSAWGQPQAELVLHFVEIGQGDCTLIECPNGGFILVDAGSTAHGDRDAVRDYVRARKARRWGRARVRWGMSENARYNECVSGSALRGPQLSSIR